MNHSMNKLAPALSGLCLAAALTTAGPSAAAKQDLHFCDGRVEAMHSAAERSCQ